MPEIVANGEPGKKWNLLSARAPEREQRGFTLSGGKFVKEGHVKSAAAIHASRTRDKPCNGVRVDSGGPGS